LLFVAESRLHVFQDAVAFRDIAIIKDCFDSADSYQFLIETIGDEFALDEHALWYFLDGNPRFASIARKSIGSPDEFGARVIRGYGSTIEDVFPEGLCGFIHPRWWLGIGRLFLVRCHRT